MSLLAVTGIWILIVLFTVAGIYEFIRACELPLDDDPDLPNDINDINDPTRRDE